MNDKEKFYKLVLNILNYEPKETVCYDGKLAVFNIYLGDTEEFQLQFRVEEKELWLFLNIFNAYHLSENNYRDLDKIIKILQHNKIGQLILEDIDDC